MKINLWYENIQGKPEGRKGKNNLLTRKHSGKTGKKGKILKEIDDTKALKKRKKRGKPGKPRKKCEYKFVLRKLLNKIILKNGN